MHTYGKMGCTSLPLLEGSNATSISQLERQIGFIALLLTSRVFDTNMSSALELVKEVRVALPTSLTITTKAAQTESSVSLTSVKFYSSGQINAKFWAVPFSMPDSGVNNEYVRAVEQ